MEPGLLIYLYIERRRREGPRMRGLDGISRHEFELLQEMVKDRKPGVLQSMGLQRVRHD